MICLLDKLSVLITGLLKRHATTILHPRQDLIEPGILSSVAGGLTRWLSSSDRGRQQGMQFRLVLSIIYTYATQSGLVLSQVPAPAHPVECAYPSARP